MPPLPETVLQFGAGRFLRAFLDRFIHQANEAGQAVGHVVIVQSTPGPRADLINAQPDGYNVLVRGIEDGEQVIRVEPVRCVRRGLIAQGQWDQVLTLAKSPDLRYIVSNTTESGYTLSPDDSPAAAPPTSFPAKLTQVLHARFQAKGTPLTLLPCELFELNADRLRSLVVELAKKWNLSADFLAWVEHECLWLNNLVDCIITDGPTDHPLAAKDKLLVCAEPYALLAIQKPKGRDVPLFSHPFIHVVDDVQPFHLRKVRMLNGLHTAMVGQYLGRGFATVQQLIADKAAARWSRDVLYEEIVPTIAHRVEGVALFADQTWDRFRNPFLEHKLADIAKYHADKLKIRLQPTFDEYLKLFGKKPSRLAEVLARGVPS